MLALSLHGGLDGIDVRQNHSKARRSHAHKDGFDRPWKFSHKGIAFQARIPVLAAVSPKRDTGP